MPIQDVFQALQMFQQGVQEASIAGGIEDARAQIQNIHTQIQDEGQKRTALQSLSNDLALRLTGAGASGTQIQSAFNAVNPQSFGSVEQMQLEGQLSGNKQLQGISSNIMGERVKRKKEELLMEHQFKMQQIREAGMMDLAKAGASKRSDAAKMKIPGFEVVGDFTPSAEDITTLKKANSSLGSIDKAILDMEKLVGEEGTEAFSMFGPTSSMMAGKHTDIKLKLKELYGMGALQEHELKALNDVIPDPTAIFTTGETWKKQTDAFKETLLNTVSASAEARGYRFTGGMKSAKGLENVPGVGWVRPTVKIVPGEGAYKIITVDGKDYRQKVK